MLNVDENSRWYSGSGVYRPIWMIKTDLVFLDEWDTQIYLDDLHRTKAKVKLNTIVYNALPQEKYGKVGVEIYSPLGKLLNTLEKNITIAKEDQKRVDFLLSIKTPQLWSIETPVLYRAKIKVMTDSSEDEITIPFGLRTIEITPKKGFLLNGNPLYLKGGCVHHDNGLLGAAAIDRAEERKVELLKANGYNAVRCAHNPPSESFLSACDRLGLLVINESFDQWQRPKRKGDYHQYFDEWSDFDLQSLVRRDRNHPSIIMWSIGNEIEDRGDEPGVQIAKHLRDVVEALDTTRFITAGVNEYWDNHHLNWDDDSEKAFRYLDVSGYNYMWKKYESDHVAFPKRVMYGSESVPKEAAINWSFVENYPYVIGDFVWTAIDYLGEAGLAHVLELDPEEHDPQFMGWPWYNAWCGDIDFCGDKKPQSYYRDIVWREREITMAVQPPVTLGKEEVVNFWGWRNELLSWDWKGYEGELMRVRVYSRRPKIKLYQDGNLIGERDTDLENYYADFQVKYQPGILRAVAVKDKKEQDEVILKTSGAPVSIRLSADRKILKASKSDLSYVKIEIVDDDGQVVFTDVPQLRISSEGVGKIIAAGNGSPKDMNSFRSLNPRVFRGKAVAIVQPTAEKGTIKVCVSADGFREEYITIEVK